MGMESAKMSITNIEITGIVESGALTALILYSQRWKVTIVGIYKV